MGQNDPWVAQLLVILASFTGLVLSIKKSIKKGSALGWILFWAFLFFAFLFATSPGQQLLDALNIALDGLTRVGVWLFNSLREVEPTQGG